MQQICDTTQTFICDEGNEDARKSQRGTEDQDVTGRDHKNRAKNLGVKHPAGVTDAPNTKPDDIVDSLREQAQGNEGQIRDRSDQRFGIIGKDAQKLSGNQQEQAADENANDQGKSQTHETCLLGLFRIFRAGILAHQRQTGIGKAHINQQRYRFNGKYQGINTRCGHIQPVQERNQNEITEIPQGIFQTRGNTQFQNISILAQMLAHGAGNTQFHGHLAAAEYKADKNRSGNKIGNNSSQSGAFDTHGRKAQLAENQNPVQQDVQKIANDAGDHDDLGASHSLGDGGGGGIGT